MNPFKKDVGLIIDAGVWHAIKWWIIMWVARGVIYVCMLGLFWLIIYLG